MKMIKLALKISLLLVLVLQIASCSRDSDTSAEITEEQEQEESSENNPPENFSLTNVQNGSEDITTFPTLSWENAVDPDGDSVTYTLLLGLEETPTIKYEENISETTFTISESLSLSSQYYWKVVAEDGLGGITESEIFSFTTEGANMNFKAISLSTTFHARSRQTSIVFDNKLWVIAGRRRIDGTFIDQNDVWYSNDGENWEIATENTMFSPRSALASVVFDNKIWITGGRTGAEDFKNDVWYSSDGINWVEATANAPFPKREDHTMAVFDDKIWVIGGWDLNNGLKSDAWYSSNGVNWTKVSAPFEARYATDSAVFDDKLWVIAGGGNSVNKNDVWYTSDGSNWVQVTNNASFSKRNALSLVVYDDKLWVIGGYNHPNFLKDMWYSHDGVGWAEATSSTPFMAVGGQNTVVFNDKIWITDLFWNNTIWSIESSEN